jgi:hypothetical protein
MRGLIEEDDDFGNLKLIDDAVDNGYQEICI